jgi:hypothetical protein
MKKTLSFVVSAIFALVILGLPQPAAAQRGGHGGGGFHGGGGGFHGSGSFHGGGFSGSAFHGGGGFHGSSVTGGGFHGGGGFHNGFHGGAHNGFHDGFHDGFHGHHGHDGWWGGWGWGWGFGVGFGWGWPGWGYYGYPYYGWGYPYYHGYPGPYAAPPPPPAGAPPAAAPRDPQNKDQNPDNDQQQPDDPNGPQYNRQPSYYPEDGAPRNTAPGYSPPEHRSPTPANSPTVTAMRTAYRTTVSPHSSERTRALASSYAVERASAAPHPDVAKILRALREMPPYAREREIDSGRYSHFSPEEKEQLRNLDR